MYEMPKTIKNETMRDNEIPRIKPVAEFVSQDFHESSVDSIVCFGDGLIASKGGYDDPVNVWSVEYVRDQMSRKKVPAYKMKQIFGKPLSKFYFSKMCVLEKEGKFALIGPDVYLTPILLDFYTIIDGRNDGSIGFYSYKKGRSKKDGCHDNSITTPAKFEIRPHCNGSDMDDGKSPIIWCVSCSFDGRFLVCVDDKQIVCIFENKSV